MKDPISTIGSAGSVEVREELANFGGGIRTSFSEPAANASSGSSEASFAPRSCGPLFVAGAFCPDRPMLWKSMLVSGVAEVSGVAILLVISALVITSQPEGKAYVTVPLATRPTMIRIPKALRAPKIKVSLPKSEMEFGAPLRNWVRTAAALKPKLAPDSPIPEPELMSAQQFLPLPGKLTVPQSQPRRPVQTGNLIQANGSGNSSLEAKGAVQLGGLSSAEAAGNSTHRGGNGSGVRTDTFGKALSEERIGNASLTAPPGQNKSVAILAKPTPVYTAEALKRRIEGDVFVLVRFRADGTIRVLGIDRGLGYGLDEAAMHAAEQIKFQPAMKSGTPTDFDAIVRIEFRLAY